MNFVSHYFLDGIENRPYYNLGLLLPDMFSICQIPWRYSQMIDENTPQVSDLLRGIEMHQLLDSDFHHSQFFKDYTKYANEHLTLEPLHLRRRKFFIAHVLVELVIDQVIIKNNEEILHELYDELDQIDVSFLPYLFPSRPGWAMQLITFFENFRTKRYLFNYTRNEAIVFVINKILERVNIPLIQNQKDLLELNTLINNMHQKIQENFYQLSEIRPII